MFRPVRRGARFHDPRCDRIDPLSTFPIPGGGPSTLPTCRYDHAAGNVRGGIGE